MKNQKTILICLVILFILLQYAQSGTYFKNVFRELKYLGVSTIFNLLWVFLRGAFNIFVIVNGILALTSTDMQRRDHAWSLFRYAYVTAFLIAVPLSVFSIILTAKYMFTTPLSTVIYLGEHVINIVLIVFLIRCKPENPVVRVNLQQYDLVSFTTTGHRFVHYLLDTLFILPLLVSLGSMISYADHFNYDREFLAIAVLVLELLTLFLYHFLSEAMFQQTFGKMMTKSCVVTNGVEFSNGRMFVRTLCRFIPFDGFSFLFGANWHDKVSATSVVYVNSWENAFKDKANSDAE